MIEIEVLLSEEQIADEFLAALAQRNLPEKFFYWLPLSVRAWLELCRGAEYKNFARSLRLISSHADQIAASVPGPTLEVISLGSGQGEKDLLVLQALRRAGCEVSYRPVDSSQALLELACAQAVEAGLPARGLKADLLNRQHLERLKSHAGGPCLFLLLGNTLGGFDPLEFMAGFRRILAPADRLLVDGEIYGGAETMAGYDNPVNRRFAFAPLRSIGIQEEDGDLCFETAADERREGLFLISKHFRPGRDLDLLVSGKRLHLARGERVVMNFSYKYTRPAFLELVSRDAGLNVLEEHRSDDKRFVMVLAARAA